MITWPVLTLLLGPLPFPGIFLGSLPGFRGLTSRRCPTVTTVNLDKLV